MGPSTATQSGRDLYPALAAGDRARLDELLHPDFVGSTTEGLPLGLGGTYTGAKAMRREFWGAIGRAFDVRAEPEEFIELPDGRMLVVGRYIGSGRSTGGRVDARFMHLLSFAGDKIIGLTQLTDSARWSAALLPGNPQSPAVSRVSPEPETPLTAVRFWVEDAIAHIHLNRPDQANSQNEALARDLLTAAGCCAHDDGVRVVLITGEGRRFSAGGDISLFAATPSSDLPGLLDRMIDDYHRALAVLGELRIPVVCAVQGATAGGSLGLLYAADIVIAAQGTKFALGYAAIGLGSDGANSWFLPRIVGPTRAALMFLENQVIGTDDALKFGLISEIVAPEKLLVRATEIATRLAAGPTRALGTMRALLRRSWSATFSDHLADEQRTMVELSGTADAAEGISAFIDRREPHFNGK